jgi:transcription initiation factor IIE alpha subunit
MTDIQFPPGFIRGAARVELAELVRDIGPIPGHDLVQLTGRYRAVVSKALYALREAKLIYIQGWTHPGDSNILAPVWAWRTSPKQRDAKRPAPMSRTEINVRWNARHKAKRNIKQRLERGTQVTAWTGLL